MSKNAVTRNKIKRIFRKDIEKFDFINNIDLILIVYPNSLENIDLIPNELQKTLRKVNIYWFNSKKNFSFYNKGLSKNHLLWSWFFKYLLS